MRFIAPRIAPERKGGKPQMSYLSHFLRVFAIFKFGHSDQKRRFFNRLFVFSKSASNVVIATVLRIFTNIVEIKKNA